MTAAGDVGIAGFEALTIEAFRQLRREKDDEVAQLKAEIQSLREQNRVLSNSVASSRKEALALASRMEAIETLLSRRNPILPASGTTIRQ